MTGYVCSALAQIPWFGNIRTAKARWIRDEFVSPHLAASKRMWGHRVTQRCHRWIISLQP
jgi:hypothetical protein